MVFHRVQCCIFNKKPKMGKTKKILFAEETQKSGKKWHPRAGVTCALRMLTDIYIMQYINTIYIHFIDVK